MSASVAGNTPAAMIATVGHLAAAGAAAPVCIGIHAVFADRAHDDLLAAGAVRIATCNTILHGSNAIDVDDAIADEARTMISGG